MCVLCASACTHNKPGLPFRSMYGDQPLEPGPLPSVLHSQCKNPDSPMEGRLQVYLAINKRMNVYPLMLSKVLCFKVLTYDLFLFFFFLECTFLYSLIYFSRLYFKYLDFGDKCAC